MLFRSVNFGQIADIDGDGKTESCAEILGVGGYNCAKNQLCSEVESPEDIYEETKDKLATSLVTRGTIDCSGKQISATVENTGNSSVRAANTNVFVYDTDGNVAASKERVDLSDQQWTSSGKSDQISITGLSSSFTSGKYYSIELRFVQQDYNWTMGRCRAQ